MVPSQKPYRNGGVGKFKLKYTSNLPYLDSVVTCLNEL